MGGPADHLVDLAPRTADVGVADSALTAGPAETLPRTGAPAAEITRLALLLLAVGVVLVLGAGRPRRRLR